MEKQKSCTIKLKERIENLSNKKERKSYQDVLSFFMSNKGNF